MEGLLDNTFLSTATEARMSNGWLVQTFVSLKLCLNKLLSVAFATEQFQAAWACLVKLVLVPDERTAQVSTQGLWDAGRGQGDSPLCFYMALAISRQYL